MKKRSRKVSETNDMMSLSRDGPMGWANLTFIQAIMGCTHALPDNKYCKGIVIEMSKMTGKDHDCDTSKNYTKPWADFVQAVLDGKVKDSICEKLLCGASIVPIGDQFDFILSQKAILEAQESGKIALRASKAMLDLSNRCVHSDCCVAEPKAKRQKR